MLTNDSGAALAKPRPDRIRGEVKARSEQPWRNALLCKLEEKVDMAGDPGNTQRGPAGGRLGSPGCRTQSWRPFLPITLLLTVLASRTSFFKDESVFLWLVIVYFVSWTHSLALPELWWSPCSTWGLPLSQDLGQEDTTGNPKNACVLIVTQCPEGFPSSVYCGCSQSPHWDNPQRGLCSCRAHSSRCSPGLTPWGRRSVSQLAAPPSSGLLTSSESQKPSHSPTCNAGSQDWGRSSPLPAEGRGIFPRSQRPYGWEMLRLRACFLQLCPSSHSHPALPFPLPGVSYAIFKSQFRCHLPQGDSQNPSLGETSFFQLLWCATLILNMGLPCLE